MEKRTEENTPRKAWHNSPPGLPAIRKNLLQLVFSGAYLWRWNDKLRPCDLVEIEKQAHKMIVACMLWHESSKNWAPREKIDLAAKIIEGALFDYFYRLIITDIKPPVFYRIKAKRADYEQLTEYVLERLGPTFASLGFFWKKMRAWYLQEDVEETPERRILRAAHLIASQWEYKLIRPLNFMDDEMEGIGRTFRKELAAFTDLPGMSGILEEGSALARFVNLCGQLRFQIRWTRAPRIPATSVLGHMFIVAALAYFFSLSIGACQARCNNNFFSGLFHDFPEVLTRDIISPVKMSSPGLSRMIKEYESDEMGRRVLTSLREAGFTELVNRISFYLGLDVGSEFQESRMENGKIIKCAGFEGLQKYNSDKFDPKDGKLLKVCDVLAAFLEAHNSINTGISSSPLLAARERLKNSLRENSLEELQIDALLADFE